MTFSMPSPVELTQLKIQYQRNVGTASASNRIELGATAPAPGSTSSASTFLSLTRERLGFYGRGSCPGLGAARSPHPPRSRPRPRRSLCPAARGPGGPAARAQPARPCHPRPRSHLLRRDEKLGDHAAVSAGADHTDADSSELGSEDVFSM